MTRKELREHCKKTVESCEMWAKAKGEEPSGKVYEEHKLILELLEQEPIIDKIMEEIEQVKSIMNEEIINNNRKELINFINGLNQSLVIVERYKAESEDKYV